MIRGTARDFGDGRVVGMEGDLYASFLGDGDDGAKKVLVSCPELFVRDAPGFHQRRGPAHDFVVIPTGKGAAPERYRNGRARPAGDRHPVVTKGGYAQLTHGPELRAEPLDLFVAARADRDGRRPWEPYPR